MFTVCRVEVVLDTVVATPRQLLCDFSPLVAHLLVQVKDDPLFIDTDRVLHNLRVQVVMPSIRFRRGGSNSLFSSLSISKIRWYLPLAALLAGARANFVFVLQTLGYESPPFCPILVYQLHNGVVLLHHATNCQSKRQSHQRIRDNGLTYFFQSFRDPTN